MSIRERQRGQPAPIATKVSTQAVQKRACPQGTKATPAGEAIKHTSHVEKRRGCSRSSSSCRCCSCWCRWTWSLNRSCMCRRIFSVCHLFLVVTIAVIGCVISRKLWKCFCVHCYTVAYDSEELQSTVRHCIISWQTWSDTRLIHKFIMLRFFFGLRILRPLLRRLRSFMLSVVTFCNCAIKMNRFAWMSH